MTQKVKLASLDLANALVEGILEKKGEEILVLDLKKLPHAMADYFIICEASNERQVNAIADQLEREVRKKIKEKGLEEKISLQQADSENLPFEDNYFDAVQFLRQT